MSTQIPQLEVKYFLPSFIWSIIFFLLFYVVFRLFLHKIITDIQKQNKRFNYLKRNNKNLEDNNLILQNQVDELETIKNSNEEKYNYLQDNQHQILFQEEKIKLDDSSDIKIKEEVLNLRKNLSNAKTIEKLIVDSLNKKNTKQ